MTDLLAVKDALSLILKGVKPLPGEEVSLAIAAGRVLAKDLAATRTQPPFDASAMDGYAVRAQDLKKTPCRLDVVGESAAGHGFSGNVGKGEAVRIFTGAPLPTGADAIVIQENVQADNGTILVQQSVNNGTYVRPAGLDFKQGEVLIRKGTLLDAGTISLAAAMNHAKIPVIRKPRIAIIATGDELVMPGTQPKKDQIVASNSFGVATIVTSAGGDFADLGIANDTIASLEEKFSQSGCAQADIVITLGGASVGDHDLVRAALQKQNIRLDFWKLAMRPGKPVMFGASKINGNIVRHIGLPGNPVSSLVCAKIFVEPLIKKLLGLHPANERHSAILGCDLPQNDQREEYMRATIQNKNGETHVTPFEKQDSSIITLYARADCLLIRPAHAKAAAAGSSCEIIKI